MREVIKYNQRKPILTYVLILITIKILSQGKILLVMEGSLYFREDLQENLREGPYRCITLYYRYNVCLEVSTFLIKWYGIRPVESDPIGPI